jgi:hypothetical protein
MTALLMMTRAGSPIQLFKSVLDPKIQDSSYSRDIRVELTVSLVGHQHLVTEEVARSLGLFGKGDHVRGRGQVPVGVSPKLPVAPKPV